MSGRLSSVWDNSVHFEILTWGSMENRTICKIYWKWLIVERNKWKFRTSGSMKCIFRVFSCLILWVQFGIIHFAELPTLKFSKGYCSHSVHSISTKLYGKYGKGWGYRLLLFGKVPYLNFYGTLKCLLTQDNMVLEIQNATPPAASIRSQPNFMSTLVATVEYRLLLSPTIAHVLELLWHFNIFNMRVNGKS